METKQAYCYSDTEKRYIEVEIPEGASVDETNTEAACACCGIKLTPYMGARRSRQIKDKGLNPYLICRKCKLLEDAIIRDAVDEYRKGGHT